MIDPTQPLPNAVPESNNSKKAATPASWKPGQSGNPAGRPKKDWTWKELLEEAAEEIIEIKGKDGAISARKELKKLVARKLLTLAAGGNVQAARELMNRMDGMPQQKVDVEASGDWNVTLKRDEK